MMDLFGGAPQTIAGVRFHVSANVLRETRERLFPESKHRSKRIHKKLVKRHGGEFRKAPAIFRAGDQVFIHPELYARMKAELERAR